MVADIVFTDVVGERGTFEEAGPEAIAARYHEWGASEILVYAPGKDVMHSTLEMGIRWLDVDPSLRADLRNSAYLAARIAGASSSEAAAAIFRKDPRD
jgi:fructose-1,6-bisphosphatase